MGLNLSRLLRQEGTITEILGFFIILGVLVVVVLRHQIWPHTEGGRGKAEEVEEASRRMKREMERSADEIIERMGEHIERLEHLVKEADERAKALEEQLASLRHPALSERSEARADDFDDLLAASLAVENDVGQISPRLRPPPALAAHEAYEERPFYDAVEPMEHAEEVDLAEERFVDASYRDSNLLTVAAWEDGTRAAEEPEVVVSASVADVADLPLTPEEEAWAAAEEGLPEIIGDRSPVDEEVVFKEAGTASAAYIEAERTPDLPSEQRDAFFTAPIREDEAAELHDPLAEAALSGQEAKEETERDSETADSAAAEDVLAHGERLTEEKPQGEEPHAAPLFTAPPLPEGDSTAQKIRERLAQGTSTADIAREFHIGRGAVELISQMEKNKAE